MADKKSDGFRKDIVSSFTDAFRGLFFITKTQRNFRIHLFIAAFVILCGLFLKMPLVPDFLILILVVLFVVVAEIMNTVVEMMVDLLIDTYDIKARRIKDVAASVVLVASGGAVITGYLILAKYFPPSFRNAFANLASSPWYFTFGVFMFIVLLYGALKSFLKKGTLIVGGMPSIHSGLAFCVWTIVSFLTFRQEPLISLLVLLLAFWVAQGRILKGIHKIEEVTIGAIGGIFITILVFQFLEKSGFYKLGFYK